jgi:hypothetical protein
VILFLSLALAPFPFKVFKLGDIFFASTQKFLDDYQVLPDLEPHPAVFQAPIKNSFSI